MPIGAIYRLQTAINNEHENPWRLRSLDFSTFQQLLNRNHVFIATEALETLFLEIEGCGNSSGRITKAKLDTWMDNYRPLSREQQRSAVLITMLHSKGFWSLILAQVGLIVVGIPLCTDLAYSLEFGIEFDETASLAGCVENCRQAWRKSSSMA